MWHVYLSCHYSPVTVNANRVRETRRSINKTLKMHLENSRTKYFILSVRVVWLLQSEATALLLVFNVPVIGVQVEARTASKRHNKRNTVPSIKFLSTLCFISSVQHSQSHRHSPPIVSPITLVNCITPRSPISQPSFYIETIEFLLTFQTILVTRDLFLETYAPPLPTRFAAKGSSTLFWLALSYQFARPFPAL